MSNSQNIRIQFDVNAGDNIDLTRLKSLIGAICAEFDAAGANIHVNIMNDAGMIDIHRQFLNKSNTTDVISFDLSDEFESERNLQIVVNLEMARRRAEKLGHSPEAELALYITHGLLHQFGYDDTDLQQAQRMHQKEDAILQSRGFGVIYHSKQNKQKRRL